ncbi:MAG: hypothetical protein LKM40_02100 [Mageeibacillus sp.]|jgi:hypothetical protein|nr:hypothetical protein [Mageeibacillus sp.]
MMVRKSEMGNFMEALEAESRRQLDENPDSLMAKDDIEIDGEIPFEAVNFDTFDTVCKLRPFGNRQREAGICNEESYHQRDISDERGRAHKD